MTVNMYLKGREPRRSSWHIILLFSGWSVSSVSAHKEGGWPGFFFFSLILKDPHYHGFTHISPLLIFYLHDISPCTIPLNHAPGSKGIFPGSDQTEKRSWAVPRMAAGRCPVRPASSLSALRPDMKGLLREIWGIVIRAFLLWIMVLPEPED